MKSKHKLLISIIIFLIGIMVWLIFSGTQISLIGSFIAMGGFIYGFGQFLYMLIDIYDLDENPAEKLRNNDNPSL